MLAISNLIIIHKFQSNANQFIHGLVTFFAALSLSIRFVLSNVQHECFASMNDSFRVNVPKDKTNKMDERERKKFSFRPSAKSTDQGPSKLYLIKSIKCNGIVMATE